MLSAWRYTDRVSEARRATLAEPGSYEEVVRLACEDARDIRVRCEKGRDRGLTDCVRPIFTLQLPYVGDPLFNGPWGYRAQYWLSPAQGLAANATLLVALAPKLLGAVDLVAMPEFAKIDISVSLSAASAKIWIQEIPSILLDPPVDLAVSRWAAEAQNGVELARWGLGAPEVTKFEVKGGLIDPYGNEVVPTRKIRRHYDIHHYGFS